MKLYLILFAFISAIAFTSCQTPKYIYTPSSANALVPEGKGSLKLAANYSSAASASVRNETASSNGGDFQSAYGITERAAIKFDAWFKKEHNSGRSTVSGIDHEDIRYKKNGFEISGGFYKLNEEKKSFLQLFAGAGFGNLSFNSAASDNSGFISNYYHKVNYFKFFFQPMATMKFSEIHSLTSLMKLNLISYSKLRTDYPDLDHQVFGHITEKPSFFLDFGFHDEFGFRGLKNVSFQAQLGYTALLTKFDDDHQNFFDKKRYDHNRLWASIGIVYSLKIR